MTDLAASPGNAEAEPTVVIVDDSDPNGRRVIRVGSITILHNPSRQSTWRTSLVMHGRSSALDLGEVNELLDAVPQAAASELALESLTAWFEVLERHAESSDLVQHVAAATGGWVGSQLELGRADDSIVEALQRAFDDAAQSLRWSQAVGERLSTSEVCDALGVTRQALANRRKSGSLIALEGDRTSWWPSWQFTRDRGRLEVRPAVAAIVAAFRSVLGDDATEFVIVGWASTPNPALDGRSPAAWLDADGDADRVISAAVEDASAEAR